MLSRGQNHGNRERTKKKTPEQKQTAEVTMHCSCWKCLPCLDPFRNAWHFRVSLMHRMAHNQEPCDLIPKKTFLCKVMGSVTKGSGCLVPNSTPALRLEAELRAPISKTNRQEAILSNLPSILWHIPNYLSARILAQQVCVCAGEHACVSVCISAEQNGYHGKIAPLPLCLWKPLSSK